MDRVLSLRQEWPLPPFPADRSGNQGRQIKPPRFHEAGGKREFLIGAQRAADRDFQMTIVLIG